MNFRLWNLNSNHGQIILIILLVMAVGVTVGLSVANRAVTDVKISTQIEESNRAFSAAEAGIESILNQNLASVSGATLEGSLGPNDEASYRVEVTSVGNDSDIFSFPDFILDGDHQTVWLVNQGADGPVVDTRIYNSDVITVCWKGTEGVPDIPAIEISAFMNDSGEFKVAREYFDPDSGRIVSEGSGFATVSDQSGGYCDNSLGTTYTYRVNVNFITLDPEVTIVGDYVPVAIRVRPIYANSYIAVQRDPAAVFPEQGKNIVSTGTTDTGVTRKWNVEQYYSAPQDIFEYAVWSGGSLTKQ